MSYLALYRQYRPRTFAEVIGQDHIIKTLSAQITGGRVGHAYLFTGSRGTGKTTTAKIFAKAVNCLAGLADGSPCGKCASCTGGENIDIIEIDGASSNRVEVIRDIKEQVKYPPVNGKYKVYIIDEVHMLTDSSYNALLKTLEEPPPSVVFVLATTEPHKIPATILSRCMRFDFRLVPTDLIAGIVKDVYTKAGVKADSDAIRLIARGGQGSVRDALSLADKCVGITDGVLTYDYVLEAIGASDSTSVAALGNAVLGSDMGAIMSEVDKLVMQGKSVSLLAKDLTSYFRDLGVAKTAPDASVILELPSERIKELTATANTADINKIIYCIDIFGGLDRELRYGLMPRIILENACIKAAQLISNGDINAILARIAELEKKNPNDGQDDDTEAAPKVSNNRSAVTAQMSEVVEDNITAIKADEATKGHEPENVPVDPGLSLLERHIVYGGGDGDIWEQESVSNVPSKAEMLTSELIKQLGESGEMMLKLALTDAFCRSRLDGDKLICSVKDSHYHSILKKPENLTKINRFVGEGLRFESELVEDNTVDEDYIKRKLKEYAGDKLEIVIKK